MLIRLVLYHSLAIASISPGTLGARQASDIYDVQAAAIAYLNPGKVAGQSRVVFDEQGQGRARPESESATLKNRFGLLTARSEEKSKCTSDKVVVCGDLPVNTTVVDVSLPVFDGVDKATVTVRARSSKRGVWHTLSLVRTAAGWHIVSGKSGSVG